MRGSGLIVFCYQLNALEGLFICRVLIGSGDRLWSDLFDALLGGTLFILPVPCYDSVQK